jgi:putative transposase
MRWPTAGPFRVVAAVDQWSRQSPLLEVASSLSGATVGVALDRVLPSAHGLRLITVDHGTEFMSRALDDWAYQHGVQLDFIRPGKPVENAFIESFNGRAGRVPERPPVHLDRRRQGQD